MNTQNVDVTGTPTDIVAALSLTPGRYTVQNTTAVSVFLSEADPALADPSTLTRGHILGLEVTLGITVTPTNAIYLWTADTQFSGQVAVSRAE